MMFYHLLVKLRFLSASEGGRYSAAKWGYRPQFYYDGIDCDAAHKFYKKEVLPGEETISILAFMCPHLHLSKMHAGKEFKLREGTRIVAEGIVLEIMANKQSLIEYFQTCYLAADPEYNTERALKDFARYEDQQKCEQLLIEIATALTKFEEL